MKTKLSHFSFHSYTICVSRLPNLENPFSHVFSVKFKRRQVKPCMLWRRDLRRFFRGFFPEKIVTKDPGDPYWQVRLHWSHCFPSNRRGATTAERGRYRRRCPLWQPYLWSVTDGLLDCWFLHPIFQAEYTFYTPGLDENRGSSDFVHDIWICYILQCTKLCTLYILYTAVVEN